MTKAIVKRTEFGAIVKQNQIDLVVNPREVELLKARSKNLLAKGLFTDADSKEYATAIELTKTMSERLTKARTTFVRKMKADVQEIEKQFNDPAGELKKLNADLSDEWAKYEQKKQREAEKRAAAAALKKRQEDEAQRQAEQRRQAEEAQHAEQEDLWGDDETDQADCETEQAPGETTQQKPEPIQPEILPPEPVAIPKMDPPKMKTETGGHVKLKTEPIPHIKDKAAVPEEYKDVNVTRLKDAWRRGITDIPGVWFEEKAVTGVYRGKGGNNA